MKILITGAKGFIGKYLSEKFGNECIATTRETLDLSKKESVDKFFSEHGAFDAIIHCAIKGGRRIVQYGPEILYENLLAFENLVRHAPWTTTFISYSSGAEFSIDSNNYYGMSKHIISHRLLEYKNAVNVRIYNCFGEAEEPQRFIKTCIRNCLQNKDITIFKDKYMDFFYIEDLYRLTKHIISSGKRFDVIDAVYEDKLTLLDAAAHIRTATKGDCCIRITDHDFDKPYTGDGSLLESLNLPLVGFRGGIHNTIEYMKHGGI